MSTDAAIPWYGLISSGWTTPVADFSISDSVACPMTPITFNDASTGPVIPITGWFWDFGDGNTSTQQNPVHQYPSPGVYTVTLTVIDSLSCTDAVSRTALVTILPTPTSTFAVNDHSGCTPHSTSFTNLSTPATAPIISYLWRFGDGNTTGATNPSHTYTSHGLYTVTLVVTDLNGCQDSTTASVNSLELPVADFSSVDSFGCNAQFVRFTDQTSSPYLITSWNWDFGDGNTSTSQSPIHTYTGLGPYTVKLVVVDANGCTDSITRPNYVTLFDPAADFTYDNTRGCPGMTVNFQDSSSTDTTIASWAWDFGDGFTSSLQNPSHSYTTPGVYTVTLSVTTVIGCVTTQVKNNIITIITPPTPSFSFTPTAGCPPLPVQFTDNSTPNTTAITAWNWDFGNGNTSTAQHPLETFMSPGTYSIQLVVTDNDGCQDSISQSLTVDPAITANFFSNDTLGCATHNADFFDISTGPIPAVAWQWDFGDGNTSTAQNPSNVYTSDGSYTVTLIVTDANGCMDTLTRVNYINLTNPDADFILSPGSGCPGLTYSFQDQSIPDYPIVSWVWDFGDGDTSHLQNPTHVYASPGVYTVTLTVTNINGCSDTEVKTSYVTIYQPPVAVYTAIPSAGCAPHFVQFTDNSVGVSSPLASWAWDFGDGNSSTTQNPSHTFTSPEAIMCS